MAENKFYTLQASADGEVTENKSYFALARNGRDSLKEPDINEMCEIPYGTDVFLLPGRDPMGVKKGKREHYFQADKEKVTAVGFIPPPGYTRTLLPAYHVNRKEPLPFFAYTMGALYKEEFYIAAIKTDSSLRWDPTQYDSPDLKNKIKKKLKLFPANRLLKHLSVCAVEYSCYNAQNIFYDRWEGGIPTSPACNANCEGCISKKRKKGPPSPQDRIKFVPTADEIEEIAVPHLERPGAIISFGQGCEGEPLLQAELIEKAIRQIRAKTDQGTIHINTNGSKPLLVKKLIAAGLNTIRVSMNSAVKENYDKFFQPADYMFKEVKETVRLAVDEGLFVSINFLTMPGFNDNEYEFGKFIEFLDAFGPSMIQMRNLNMDPEMFYDKMPTLKGKPLGIVKILKMIKERYGDKILIGNFNRPRDNWL